jgi:hypothetical protein
MVKMGENESIDTEKVKRVCENIKKENLNANEIFALIDILQRLEINRLVKQLST